MSTTNFFDSVGFSDDVATMLSQLKYYGIDVGPSEMDPINNSNDLEMVKIFSVVSDRYKLEEIKKSLNVEFTEDFNKLDDSLWTIGGTGAVGLIDGVGGVIRFLTGSTTGNSVDLGFIGNNVHFDCKYTITFRAKLEDISNTILEMGAVNDSNGDLVRFIYDSSFSSNWISETKMSGLSSLIDTGITGDTNWHIFKLQSTGKSLIFCIDEIHLATHDTNLSNSLMKLYIKQSTLSDSGKSSLCDFVKHNCFRK